MLFFTQGTATGCNSDALWKTRVGKFREVVLEVILNFLWSFCRWLRYIYFW